MMAFFLYRRRVTRSLIIAAVITAICLLFRAQLPETWLSPSGSPSERRPSDAWADRARRVRSAFLHAYEAYEQAAFPHDELKPLSNSWVDNYNGWGVSAVDALDTMILMGLSGHAQRAMKHIATLQFDDNKAIPFFETTIRYLGGLLSAYALEKDPMLLSQADKLGSKLLRAFDTPTGLPDYSVNMYFGQPVPTNELMLAEIASFQLEFRALSYWTKKVEYSQAADNVTRHLRENALGGGLYPTGYSRQSGKPTNAKFSAGALSDSAYEYLLKMYLQTNSTDLALLSSYMSSASSIIDNLLFLSESRSLLFVTDMDRGKHSGRLEHLACFLPGMLALGVSTISPTKFPWYASSEKHLAAAEGLAETCYLLYAESALGLAADEVQLSLPTSKFRKPKSPLRSWSKEYGDWMASGPHSADSPPGTKPKALPFTSPSREWTALRPGYLLRPEAIESMYILWRTTHDTKWRDYGWAIFEAIEKHARVKHGFASIQNAGATSPTHLDDMPSWFLAETLKYAYLLCLDEDPLPLDQWIFNTEAHPLPVFERSAGQ